MVVHLPEPALRAISFEKRAVKLKASRMRPGRYGIALVRDTGFSYKWIFLTFTNVCLRNDPEID
jgi:hypothetical protein